MDPAPRLALPPPPWVVAHRGDPLVALENTLESCRLGAASGAHMLEVDLQLTADSQLVVVHDFDLGRLARHPGVVEEMTAEEVGLVALSLLRGRRRLTGAVPRLADLLAGVSPALPLNLELKRRRADPERWAEALATALAGRRDVLVSSFDHALLERVGAALPELPLAPLESSDAAALLAAGERLAAWSLHCHRRIAEPGLFAAARAAGRPVLVYTVDSVRLARRLVAAGASGIFTDHPRRLVAALLETA